MRRCCRCRPLGRSEQAKLTGSSPEGPFSRPRKAGVHRPGLCSPSRPPCPTSPAKAFLPRRRPRARLPDGVQADILSFGEDRYGRLVALVRYNGKQRAEEQGRPCVGVSPVLPGALLPIMAQGRTQGAHSATGTVARKQGCSGPPVGMEKKMKKTKGGD